MFKPSFVTSSAFSALPLKMQGQFCALLRSHGNKATEALHVQELSEVLSTHNTRIIRVSLKEQTDARSIVSVEAEPCIRRDLEMHAFTTEMQRASRCARKLSGRYLIMHKDMLKYWLQSERVLVRFRAENSSSTAIGLLIGKTF